MKPETSILPKSWLLPDAIRQRLGREPGPQRAMYEEEHLLIILHQLPQPDDHQRKPALFWRKPEGEWKTNLQGGGLCALGEHLKSFEQKLMELDDLENRAKTAADYHGVLEQLAPVLRSSRGLHRALQQAREAVKNERELINMRDQAAGIERNAELLLQDAQFGLNFTVARQAEVQATSARQMAATAHRLNLMAALFLPLTALASIFGMNMSSGMADAPVNFWLVCFAGLLLGLCVMMILGKKEG